MSAEVNILNDELLSDNWYVLRKVTFQLRNRQGEWETQAREVYDRGNGAVILLVNKEKGTVVLTRQFRMPTYVNGNESGYLIEACAGLLDGKEPDAAIAKETEEETGYRLSQTRKIGEAYMSPGSVTEILHFYVAEYDESMRIGDGGGLREEQEQIEVLELEYREALNMIDRGDITDAKTIMLLRHPEVERYFAPRRPLHILIAGPYRSGTSDDPRLIERNLERMNAAAWQVYQSGHLPVLGEWYALPLLKEAGSKEIGDAVFQSLFHPSSIRLLEHCDAVLRIGGASEGADEMVRIARGMGKPVYADLADIPAVSGKGNGAL